MWTPDSTEGLKSTIASLRRWCLVGVKALQHYYMNTIEYSTIPATPNGSPKDYPALQKSVSIGHSFEDRR